MNEFSPEELKEAHRALLSLRNKNEKASGKLKEGSWQSRLTAGVVKASDVALGLIDKNNDTSIDKDLLDESHTALIERVQGRWIYAYCTLRNWERSVSGATSALKPMMWLRGAAKPLLTRATMQSRYGARTGTLQETDLSSPSTATATPSSRHIGHKNYIV